MSSGPKDATRMVSGDSVPMESRDDRLGLDLLAAAVEEVAAELPENSVGMSWPPGDSVETTRSRRPAWLAMAATLAAITLAWPAYLGLVLLPRVTAELQAAKVAARSTGQEGPIEMKLLSPPRTANRGTAESVVKRVERRSGRSVVWLLEVPMGKRVDLASGGRVEIVSGAERLGWELDAGTVARQLDTHDGVAIMVHYDTLTLGRQRLRLMDAAQQEVVAVELLVVADGEP